jgi:hypothetical protein
MMSTTVRGQKLRELGAPKGLQVTGFRRALRALIVEFVAEPTPDELDGEPLNPDWIEYEFAEWYGDVSVVPAGFTIERRDEGRGVWDCTIHVYEIEASAPLPLWRIGAYGRIADGEGPLICLHIFDRFGRERILDNSHLEPFCFYDIFESPDVSNEQREETKSYFQELLKGTTPDSDLPKADRTRKWKAAYDALRELGVKI